MSENNNVVTRKDIQLPSSPKSRKSNQTSHSESWVSGKAIYIFIIRFSIFRSFNLEFHSIYCQIKTQVRLQNRRNCNETIVSIG